MNNQLEKLKEIIIKVSKIEDLKIEDSLANRGVTSFNIFQLLLFIESTFGVEIPPEELKAENFITINTINNLINKLNEA